MQADKYIPTPIDTSDFNLSEEMSQLVETLAENTHDVWAKGRFDDGWTFGSVRSDELKQHPCLIPYGELPECEKEYDRKTSM